MEFVDPMWHLRERIASLKRIQGRTCLRNGHKRYAIDDSRVPGPTTKAQCDDNRISLDKLRLGLVSDFIAFSSS